MTNHRQTGQATQGRLQKARPTIGFLNSDIEAEWASLPWLGWWMPLANMMSPSSLASAKS